MNDVMHDLETLGTKPGSIILSIGAVAFSDKDLHDEFYVEISVLDSELYGLSTDKSTMDWWAKQSPEARATFDRCHNPDNPTVLTLTDALSSYTAWLCKVSGTPKAGKLRLWGNGSDFDNVLLAEAYRAIGQEMPTQFWNNRCFRTLKGLKLVEEPKRQGVYHNALDDAKHQARWAVDILAHLNKAQQHLTEMGAAKDAESRAVKLKHEPQ